MSSRTATVDIFRHPALCSAIHVLVDYEVGRVYRRSCVPGGKVKLSGVGIGIRFDIDRGYTKRFMIQCIAIRIQSKTGFML